MRPAIKAVDGGWAVVTQFHEPRIMASAPPSLGQWCKADRLVGPLGQRPRSGALLPVFRPGVCVKVCVVVRLRASARAPSLAHRN